ncbi:MAG: hypothetical protein OWS74_02250 [Firmicutes bacterium]|nr:hypothetical protein [Bacillota bacterium]
MGRSRAYVAFQARLSPALKERLVRWSMDSGQSQGAIVNAALEYYLDQMEAGTAQLSSQSKKFDEENEPGT